MIIKFRLYKELAKSGIVTLVVISVGAGYFLGHPFEIAFDWFRFLKTMFGVLFLASGSSALNQVQERELDAKMPRTAKRPLPSGRMKIAEAWLFIGFAIPVGLFLLYRIGPVIALLGAAAVVSYNGLYTLWWKKHWPFAAIPGAIPGALPILIGYVAASGDLWVPGGWYLFSILFFWQMPHFWSLAIRFRDDYEKGGFPTLPVSHGTPATVDHIVIWCLCYVGLAFLAPLFLPVQWFYLGATVLISVKLLWELRGFVKAPESKKWLHFFLWVNFSLIVYLGAAAIDLWSLYLVPWWTR